MRSSLLSFAFLFAVWFINDSLDSALADAQHAESQIHVVDFLPENYKLDGTVCYQRELQQAINALPNSGGTIHFAPGKYLIDDPTGIRLLSDCELQMTGAAFLLSEKCSVDGQLFYGEDVVNVTISGGTILGRNDVWPTGVNIRGIYLTGACRNIRIENLSMQDLSSNGIGIFAEDNQRPATEIWVTNTSIDNCCNFYGDYQAPPPVRRGPEKGSTRDDQGLIAFYHVHDFVVTGCHLTNARSDGTHFYFCRYGQISNNRIYRAQMGGYFLESCQHILATNNIIRDNGSRGVTIERGSRYCTLTGNTIQGSGREGLWIPDSLHCVVTGNIFSLNGRKENGPDRHMIWNANITINEARGDKLNTPTAHYLIADNIIETDKHQIAAVRIDTTIEHDDIIVTNNVLTGPNTTLLIDGPPSNDVIVKGNVNEDRQQTAEK